MVVGGIMRFGKFDVEAKGITPFIKLAIDAMAAHCDHIYGFVSNLTEGEAVDYLRNHPKARNVVLDPTYYGQGWSNDGYAILNRCIAAVTDPIDWLLYPDSDELLPKQAKDEIAIADSNGFDVAMFHILECRGSLTKVMAEPWNSPLCAHAKALRYSPKVNFDGSSGFNVPGCYQKRPHYDYFSNYPLRHLRYFTPEIAQRRKTAGFYEEYGLKDFPLRDFDPDLTWNGYIEEGKQLVT